MKVELNDWPGERTGELGELPESDVTVWDMESLLTQVTFVPVLTVIVAGLNEKFFMLTETFEGAGIGAGVGVGVGAGAVFVAWLFDVGGMLVCELFVGTIL